MENLNYKNIEERALEIINETKPKAKPEEKGFDFSDVIEHPLFGNSATALTKTSEYLTAATGWVYACVGAISDEIANINIRLFKTNAKGEPDEVKNHPVLDLLYRANDFTTKFDLFWQTQEYLELTGEAPWLLVKDNNTITDILLLRPDLLQVKISKEKGGLIDGYTYRSGHKDIPINVEDVIFIKYPNPTKPFRGIGPLAAAARTVDIDNFSEEFNRVFFANSAMPGSILQTANKLTKDTKKHLSKAINKLYKGNSNAHKAMILENGLEWKPLQLTQKDMDFMNQQQFSRDKIMAIFRVPKSIVGLSEDVNRANAETAAYTFAKWTINPKMQRLIEQLNEFLLPQFAGTENMFLAYDNPIPENVETKLKGYESGLRAGWLSINEVRQMENLEGIGKEGDTVYLPFSLQPIGELSDRSGEDKSKIIVPKRVLGRINQQKNNNKLEKKISDEITPLVKKILVGNRKKAKKKTTEDINERFWEIMVKKANNFEKKWQKDMDVIFDLQAKETLDKMPKKAVPKSWLLDPEKEQAKFEKKFNPLILAIVEENGKDAFKLIGMEDQELDLTNPAVKEYLEERIFKISDDVNAETNKKLGKTLAEGTEAGEAIPALRKRVTTVFGAMKDYRSERIARSEVIRASNFATNEAYIQSGVVESKEWLTAMDERVCPYCNAMNGRTVGLKTDFLKDGDTVEGYTVDYENVAAPPLHPSCRCTIVPVIKT